MKVFNIVVALFVVQFLAIHSFAQNNKKTKYMVEESYESPTGVVLFDEAAYLAGTSVLNQFTNVFVVNKAAKGQGTTAQTIRMFRNGIEVSLADNKVSTGDEDVDLVNGWKRIKRKIRGLGGSESHWKHTLKGFYNVKDVYGESYLSGESKYSMPYAVFFETNDHGLALHEVPRNFSEAGHAMLGQRASSGCVRMNRNTIPAVNQAVREAGRGLIPVLDIKTGVQKVDKQGNLMTETNWKSIVIVQEVND